jgi:ABC-2 type transport system ATP-binding protein
MTIEVHDLQKVTEGVIGLDIPELRVNRGEVAVLHGPSGSGKNQIFNILIGNSQPTMGSVIVAGYNPYADKGQIENKVGVLFEDDAVYSTLSPLANLEFSCRLYGLPKTRAFHILSVIGLADQANTKISDLSSGLVRRLAMGRTILFDPEVLLLFEPFNRCDTTTISVMSKIIAQQADDGKALLIFTTDPSQLLSIADPVYTLNQGRIVATQHPKDEQGTSFALKVPAKLDDKVVLFNPADILYADASEGRAFLVTSEGRLPTQFTLTELADRLAPSGFFRAHRSYLVNLQHVREVIPYTRNSFSLRLDDDAHTEIPLSKAAAGELRELLGY